MKQILFALFAVLTSQPGLAQLTADAGPDTTWCSPNWGNTIGPQLGRAIPASGGTPPYSYEWQTINTTTVAYYLLDTHTVAHPRLINGGAAWLNTVLFRLRVTDSTGKIAYDTVKVCYSLPRCPQADYPIPKKQADTVNLKQGYTCTDAFGPLTFLHWNTSRYLSDSTDLFTKCWCPKNYFPYIATYIDRIGCPVKGWVNIYIQPNAVLNSPMQEAEIAIMPNPVTTQSELRCSEAWVGSKVILTTSEGKEVGSFIILRARMPLSSVLPKADGVYQYRVVSQSGRVFVGKFCSTLYSGK